MKNISNDKLLNYILSFCNMRKKLEGSMKEHVETKLEILSEEHKDEYSRYTIKTNITIPYFNGNGEKYELLSILYVSKRYVIISTIYKNLSCNDINAGFNDPANIVNTNNDVHIRDQYVLCRRGMHLYLIHSINSGICTEIARVPMNYNLKCGIPSNIKWREVGTSDKDIESSNINKIYNKSIRK